jgi:hypothetical protein
MGMRNIYTAIEKWNVIEVSRRRQTKYGVGSRPEEKHKAWKQDIERTSIEGVSRESREKKTKCG